VITRITTSVVVVLALSAGVAFAASQMASAGGGTDVCVNSTNGLMRASSSCRDGEYPLTIGGGTGAQATQNGTFTVPWGETGGGKALPQTGVTLSGRCETLPPEVGEIALARVLIQAPSGSTMDAFIEGLAFVEGGNPIGQSSVLTRPLSFHNPAAGPDQSGTQVAIVKANGATAAITLGGYVDGGSRTCTYLWEAVETPN
jgi:hypothetical protein